MNEQSLQHREPEVLQRSNENPPPTLPTWVPRGDIYETGTHVVLALDVPGANQEQVEVTLEGDLLVVAATPNYPTREGFTLAYREFTPGIWRREFRISAAVDRERITAQVRDGVLTVSVPKTETARRHKVPVQGL